MEVFVGRIPSYLDTSAIERFIYALVQKECRLTSASSTSTSTAVTAVPINKGFYFKLIETQHEKSFGIITFASTRVAEWFIIHARTTSFVYNHGLKVDRAKQSPSEVFVRAIAENATEQQPSASRQQQDQVFQLQLALVGHWAAKNRFSYTHDLSGDYLRLTVDEQGVIKIVSGRDSLSFLPRDVRAYSHSSIRSLQMVTFELKQNPLLQGQLGPSTRTKHHFDLPSRVVQITHRAHRLTKLLDELLIDADSTTIKPREIQVVKDRNGTSIDAFFDRSKHLGIELAFLRESLLRNELVGTSILTTLSDRLDRMVSQGQHALALLVLKNFIPRLEARKERGKSAEQIHKITLRLWDEACAEAVGNGDHGLLTFFEPTLSNTDNLLSQFLHIDVTPTRVLLTGPHFHMSNRVIRSYADHWHHFARVTFTNESREGATTITTNYGFSESEDYIRTRVLTFLKEGINVAGHHWDLLAWSSSSMSTHTVWFVTPFKDDSGRRIDANVIRNSLGNFNDVIRSPALYGARLSQAFSATASTVRIPKEHMNDLQDIVTYKDQIHTDGVGQISPALMADVWESYVSTHGEHRKRKLLKATAPSAIQIRLGGSKGMLAVNPRLSGKVVGIRPSMFKFSSGHQNLEVANSSTRCLPAKLNRPLINALDCRGVKAEAFLAIQREAISQIGRARTRFDEAARLCSAFSFGTGCNLRILFEKVHRAGLGAATVHDDSFFLVLSKAVTAAALGDMKRKARIPVKGVTLLGIADEFGYLKEGEIFVQVETVEFGQVSRRILTGRKLIGRSPTIDPSDITMIECRKPPPGHPLLQLRNVVVFNTCTRVQPLPRRLGGGDLDGDLYTVYEDERLFPPSHQPDAVFHDKVHPLTLSHDCHPHDLADFFADFMLNDFIGLVSHLHLRIADASRYGSEDPRCKTLAKLHSQATDFRKTGVAVMRAQLPRMKEPIIPDFLAQSEKREGKLVYSSKRVLGYMYRAVSWGETDTPSLDANTDPETGLERVAFDEWNCDDDDEDAASEFGSEFSSLVQPQEQSVASSLRATMGAGTAPALSTTGSSSVSATMSQAAPQVSLASRISGIRVQQSADTRRPESSVNVAPWQFKDRTFPQLFERIGWTNSHYLDAFEDDDDAISEGYRYVGLFQDFTRHLRYLSRQIAMHHPDHGKLLKSSSTSATPMDGMFLISEVYLLTGRLPWARVAKRTRNDRDNDLLDRMQSICTLLRKKLCRISEAASFEKQADNSDAQEDQAATAESEGPVAAVSPSVSSALASQSRVEALQQRSSPQGGRVPGRTTDTGADPTSSLSSAQIIGGDGSASAPYELDSSDEETPSEGARSRSATPRPQGEWPRLPSDTTNAVEPDSEDAEQAAALKRKASQEANDAERRSRSHTPTPLQNDAGISAGQQVTDGEPVDGPSTPTATHSHLSPESQPTPARPTATAQQHEVNQTGAEDDESIDMIPLDDTDDGTTTEAEDYESGAEEGELTVASAQQTVDSLWRACRFFCSPQRPRYSNVYGYNTFMITLTLHLLSMLETLKHLQRDQVGPAGRRYYQRVSTKGKEKEKVKTEPDPYDEPLEEFDDTGDLEYDEDEMVENDDQNGLDDNYSLTEATIRALNLGQMLLDDLAPSQLGFDV